MTHAILDQHGQPFAPVAKAQTSSELWSDASIRIIDMQRSSGGGTPTTFDYRKAVNQFKSWIYAAVNLNATAVASIPLRLYTRKLTSPLFRTRPVPPHRKRYLTGRTEHGPHRDTQSKIVEFGDDFEEVTDRHPVLDLIRTVNPWYNGFDLLQLLVTYLDLTGNAYWHPVIGSLGVPDELWPMPSQWVQVVPDRETFIASYVYGRSRENQQTFTPDEVIHFRTANPSNEGLWYGLGKVEAGWDAVALNVEVHQLDRSFAGNRARPDYIALCKPGTTTDQLDRFERAVEGKLRGVDKSGKFLAITTDITLQPLTFSPQDITGREDNVEEIAAVFGVPVSLLKANDPNLASASVGYASWKSNTILPLARLIEQKLNEQLLPMFGIEDDAILAFDNPVPQDRQFDLTKGTGLVGSGIRTINEERALRGDEPIEGGDVPRISGVPLDSIGQPNPMLSPFTMRQPERPVSEPAAPVAAEPSLTLARSLADLTAAVKRLEERDNAQRQPDAAGPAGDLRNRGAVGDGADGDRRRLRDPAPAAPAEPTAQRSEPAATAAAAAGAILQSEHVYTAHKAEGDDVGAATDDARDDQPTGPESDLAAAIARVLDAARSRLLAAMGLEGGKAATKRGTTPAEIEQNLRALEDLADDLKREILEPLGRMLAAGGEAGLAQLAQMGVDVAGGIFDVTNPAVAEFIERHVIRLSGQVSETVLGNIRRVLLDGVAAGSTIPEMAAAIDRAGIFDRSRATMIARTESAQAYVEGQHEAWRESEVVEGKQWVLAPNPCPFCEATAKKFNNRTIGVSDSFWRLGDTIEGTDGSTMKVNYRNITGPPLHPNCRCDTIPIVKEPE